MFRVCLLLLLSLSLSARADTAADKPQKDNAPPTDRLVPVKLGESVVELVGPWKFRIGDDPMWSQPDLNDSDWNDMDLTPGKNGYIAGWTARGYAGHSGYAWYRLQVN